MPNVVSVIRISFDAEPCLERPSWAVVMRESRSDWATEGYRGGGRPLAAPRSFALLRKTARLALRVKPAQLRVPCGPFRSFVLRICFGFRYSDFVLAVCGFHSEPSPAPPLPGPRMNLVNRGRRRRQVSESRWGGRVCPPTFPSWTFVLCACFVLRYSNFVLVVCGVHSEPSRRSREASEFRWDGRRVSLPSFPF